MIPKIVTKADYDMLEKINQSMREKAGTETQKWLFEPFFDALSGSIDASKNFIFIFFYAPKKLGNSRAQHL